MGDGASESGREGAGEGGWDRSWHPAPTGSRHAWVKNMNLPSGNRRMRQTWKQCGEHKRYTQGTPVSKSPHWSGRCHACPLLARSHKQTPVCLVAEGEAESILQQKQSQQQNPSPRGFNACSAQDQYWSALVGLASTSSICSPRKHT